MYISKLLEKYVYTLINYIDWIRTKFNIPISYEINVPLFEIKNDKYYVKIVIKPATYLNAIIEEYRKEYEEILRKIFLEIDNNILNAHLSIKILSNTIEINLIFIIYQSRFLRLPNEILLDLLIPLPYTDIKNLCHSDYELQENICDADFFWQKKLEFETDAELPIIEGHMEKVYLNYGTIWIFGDEYDRKYLPTHKKVKHIASGRLYTIYITYDDEVWSIGKNIGQFRDKSETKFFPERVFFNSDEIPIITEIKCKYSHGMALDINGNLWLIYSPNMNVISQVGFKKLDIPYRIKSFSLGEQYFTAIDENNDLWMIRQLGPNNYPVPIKLNVKAKSVSCGDNHIMIIDLDDELWGCGYNFFGQLGLSHNEDMDVFVSVNKKAKRVECGGYYTTIIDFDGILWSTNGFGSHSFNRRLQDNIFTSSGMKVKSISCGHNFAILTDMEDMIWGFGDNSTGSLGLPLNPPRKRIPNYKNNVVTNITKIDFPYKVKQISCSYYHSTLLVLY